MSSNQNLVTPERQQESKLRESDTPNAIIVSTRDSILANSNSPLKNINPSMVESTASMRFSGVLSGKDIDSFAQRANNRSDQMQKHMIEGSNIGTIEEEDLMRSVHDQDVDKSKQVYIKWDKINFYAPVKAQKSKKENLIQVEDFGNQKSNVAFQDIHTDVQIRNGKNFKHILKDQQGYVLPGESVAIMGPSGSGKTSLLNVLAGRLVLSKGSQFTGDLQVNQVSVKSQDFGKFGAFVQQDDVLIETMTATECFRFAIQLTTSGLSRKEQEKRIDSMLKRLRLLGCRNTPIGSVIKKGLSGGERKRTSIGYELITNPSLLILDEPTSGLDSHTALQISKMLCQEARRGMSILATIHQPSADVLKQFSRLIILSEGQTIYNGRTSDIPSFFQQNGIKFNKYSNPADLLLKLANAPRTINPDFSIPILAAIQQKQYKQLSYDQEKQITQGLNKNFEEISGTRSVGFLKQFYLLFKRNWLFNVRNPTSLVAMLFIACSNGFLISSVFSDLGKGRFQFPLDKYENVVHNNQVQENYLGLVFFACLDSFMIVSLFQVLQIPSLRPVFVRENASKMYSSSAYFLSGWFSSTIILMLYPFLVSAISFHFLGFNDSTIDNYWTWSTTLFVVALQGSTYGFMLGCLIDIFDVAIQILMNTLMIFLVGSGMYVNLKGANWFIRGIGYVSPFRYVIEKLMRTLLKGVYYADALCDFYDYTFKDQVLPISYGFFGIFFIVGWIAVVISARNS